MSDYTPTPEEARVTYAGADREAPSGAARVRGDVRGARRDMGGQRVTYEIRPEFDQGSPEWQEAE